MDQNTATILRYHEQTKHHPQRYARSLGYMDWNTQPNPFREFERTESIKLSIPEEHPGPTYDSVFGTTAQSSQEVSLKTISELLYYSVALSAWKQVNSPAGEVLSRWALRVNPSSGNLHPTECYILTQSLEQEPILYHYNAFCHSLEKRAQFDTSDEPFLSGGFLLGLSSIHWREAWKYGERAFRYCQHDVGHALGAIRISAALLGWKASLLDSVGREVTEKLLAVDVQEGPEKEAADCLICVQTDAADAPASENIDSFAGSRKVFGTPNTLSPSHHDWSIIEEVSKASNWPGVNEEAFSAPPLEWNFPERNKGAHGIIRQRRSAVEMDGMTKLGKDEFYLMLARLLPGASKLPYDMLWWRPACSLALFVHRVAGLQAGLYILVRDPEHESSLKRSFRDEFTWSRPPGCPSSLPLFELHLDDVQQTAKFVSCHQDIAADGVFSLGLLVEFQHSLERYGAGFYPRLFWETGLIGQMLYLEAEAAGIRGTGIGCFHDDTMHGILGVSDHSWQSLYHFTLGGPQEDSRLQTIDAYAHRAQET